MDSTHLKNSASLLSGPHSMSSTWLLNWIKGWGIWNTPLVSQWRSSTVTLVKELVVRRLKVESWPSICWTHQGTTWDTQLSRVWPKCVESPWEPGVSATWGDASDIWGWKMKTLWSFTVWVTSVGHRLMTSSKGKSLALLGRHLVHTQISRVRFFYVTCLTPYWKLNYYCNYYLIACPPTTYLVICNMYCWICMQILW